MCGFGDTLARLSGRAPAFLRPRVRIRPGEKIPVDGAVVAQPALFCSAICCA
jgi:hypothetical protein